MRNRYSNAFAPARRAVLAAFAAVLVLVAAPAEAASPVEQFVSDNVANGLVILNNHALSKDQRKDQFQSFLMGLCDLKTIAEYTLGQYRRGAAPGDLAAFHAAYKDYAMAVYASYFDKFNGQTLTVIGSVSPAPGDFVVKTKFVNPSKAGDQPSVVNFRVSNGSGKFMVIDLSYEGVWLRQTQRDDFTAYLGQHGGDVKSLIGVLKIKTEQVKADAGKKKK